MSLLKILKYLKNYKIIVIIAISILIISVFAELINPMITQWTIDCGIGIEEGELNPSEMQNRVEFCGVETKEDVINGDTTKVVLGGIGIFLFAVVAGGLNFISGRFIIKSSQGMGYDLRNDLYKKVTGFSFSNLDKWRTGELMIRMNSDVNLLKMFIRMGLFMIVQSIFMIIGGLIGMMNVSPRLTQIMLFVIPGIMVMLVIFIVFVRPLFIKVRRKLDIVNNTLQETLAGAKVVRSFSRQDYEVDKFIGRNKDFLKLYMKVGYLLSVLFPFLFFIASITLIIAVWTGGNLVAEGTLTKGQLTSFSQYTMMTTFPMLMLGMVLAFISMAFASSERVNQILKEKSTLTDPENPIKKENFTGKVEFKDVCFSYGEGEYAVCDADFIINPGEQVGLLGGTGSGKSSLVNLIPRLYDVEKGEVLIDDINVKDLSLGNLRKRIALVLQETVLFSGTIRENLIFANPGATQEEIEKAVEIACAKEFIMEKEDGFDEHVGERGTGLSGGQRQRVAIARAIIAKPDILILDDITSSVDLETEFKIYNNLRSYLKDKTTFIISQKINSIVNSDKIIVMDKGKIVGIGKHDQLIEENSIYREIYNTQNAK
jgi:ATP-binding cassette, subfamily B, multidrug efflux pump